MNDLVERLRKRAEIRRQIPSRKSVQNNEPDRIADLLEEAANRIEELESHKELSDEQIQAIADETDVLHALNKDWIFIFARAIIKASRGE